MILEQIASTVNNEVHLHVKLHGAVFDPIDRADDLQPVLLVILDLKAGLYDLHTSSHIKKCRLIIVGDTSI